MEHDQETDAFRRGVKQGQIDQTLREHGAHLEKINGSQAAAAKDLMKLASEVGEIKLEIQRMGDQMVAAANTVVATAKALKTAEDARRQADESQRIASERRWTPVQRGLALVGGLIAIGGFVLVLLAAINI